MIDCTCRQRSSTEELGFHLRLFKSSVLMNTQKQNTIHFTPESDSVVLIIPFSEGRPRSEMADGIILHRQSTSQLLIRQTPELHACLT